MGQSKEKRTRYETLAHKACILTDAAHRMLKKGNRSMALIWARKADALFEQAAELSIEEGEACVN